MPSCCTIPQWLSQVSSKRVFLIGGFANQVFQLSFANELAKNGHTVFVDTLFADLNCNIDKTALEAVGLRLKTRRFKIFPDFLNKIIRHTLQRGYFVCSDRNYTKYSNYRLFLGYWQSTTWLDKKFCRTLVNLPTEPKGLGNRIGIHIRGTDYLTNSNTYHIADWIYYKESLDLITSQSSKHDMPIMVFTDDTVHAAHILNDLRLNSRYSDFEISSSSDLIDDFASMKNIGTFVTANSSFSFLARYLVDLDEQVTVIPKLWFTKPTFKYKLMTTKLEGQWHEL